MSFDWRDYLTLARELSQREQQSYRRCAVSRAYYCAYNEARNRLRSKMNWPDIEKRVEQKYVRANSHEKVWYAFQVQGQGRLMLRIAELGFRLLQRRVHADYYSQPAMDKEAVEDSLRSAEEILNSLPRI